MPRGDCQSQPCRCAQHGNFEPIARGLHPDSKLGIAPGPVVGSVTFSAGDGQELYDLLTARGLLGCVGDPPQAHPEMVEHVRRSVDDYVAGLPEVEDDAATVVELVQRGESWHIAISRGKMYHETAEDSLGAALDAVGRILGEKPGQSVDSCAEVPTDSPEFLAGYRAAQKDATAAKDAEEAAQEQEWAAMRQALQKELDGRCAWCGGASKDDLYCSRSCGHSDGWEAVTDQRYWRLKFQLRHVEAKRATDRGFLLSRLPPCQITDPEALAKLTPSKVRSYLKGKGWEFQEAAILDESWTIRWNYRDGCRATFANPRSFDRDVPACLPDGPSIQSAFLADVARYEGRSAAAVYLDILQTEPGEGQP